MQRWIKAQCLEKVKVNCDRLCGKSYSRCVGGVGSSLPAVWRLQRGGNTSWDLRVAKKTWAGGHLKQRKQHGQRKAGRKRTSFLLGFGNLQVLWLAGEEALRREIMWGRFFQVSSCRAFYTKIEFGPFAATGNLFFIVRSRLSVKVYWAKLNFTEYFKNSYLFWETVKCTW